jgi:solute carrier family 25 carnitine/acylcarnitine transporter 20/29
MEFFLQEIITGTKDFIAGTFAGLALLVSGYPFDTVKVRMQLHSISMKICLNQLVKEGYPSFFSGINYPLKTVPLANAVLFYSY